jgi:hypothetical protein
MKQPQRTPEQARQGATPGVMLYVLAVSLVLVILGLTVAYLVS